jgi:ABC-type lipoprotein release transport system permease subunit
MRALPFAARTLVRQPGRAAIGVLGVAAVGALLFDMLLLSRGLVVSFRDLLESVGFDVRVMATEATPLSGPRLAGAGVLARQLAALPEVAEVVPMRIADAETPRARGKPIEFTVMGIDARNRRPWTVVAGRDIDRAPRSLLVNRALMTALRATIGDAVSLRIRCSSDRAPLAPVEFRIEGLAEFPFDDAAQRSAVASLATVSTACGIDEGRDVDMLLIASREGYGADLAAAAIRRTRPDVHAATNEEIVARMQQSDFTYFRQISTVLSTITLLFAFLLITVLLTVSVNQRLAELAALRALGFSRARVVKDVLAQSALLVGCGGAFALPLGYLLSLWLDAILKAMPGVPAALHFFVFERRALLVHGALLGVVAFAAAIYPMRLVARLPIAETLRNEIVG